MIEVKGPRRHAHRPGGMRAALLCAAVMTSACATQYQSSGLTGGHTESNAPGHLFRVDFYGNGYVDANTVNIYAMYRAAEIAQGRRKPHFLVYESLIAAAEDKPSDMPRVGSLGNKPWAYAFVQFLDAPMPGSHETQAVLRKYEATVKAPPAR